MTINQREWATMQYYIREWHDRSASLIAEDGHWLETFPSVNDAISACIHDCCVKPQFVERHSNYLGNSPQDFESSFL